MSRTDRIGAGAPGEQSFLTSQDFAGGRQFGAPALTEEEDALEAAYSAWQGKWGHALDLGGFGDLLELRDALNAAAANFCKSS
jgi:hypothetical protein